MKEDKSFEIFCAICMFIGILFIFAAIVYAGSDGFQPGYIDCLLGKGNWTGCYG